MAYLEVKALHIILVVCWFAGLFYLPRLFVNLAMVPADSVAERERLLLMAGKLYRFMTPIGYLALLSGLWLWLGVGISGPWLHAKLTAVVLLVGYNHYCRKLLREFQAGTSVRSHVWFRWFNEAPVLLLAIVVVLAVLKPF
jgi:putative membrane protein